MVAKHLDEARRDTIAALIGLLDADPAIERAVLIDDLFGRVRVVLWGAKENAEEQTRRVTAVAGVAADRFWGGDVWHAGKGSKADRLVYDRVWDEAHTVAGRLRLAERVRNRTAWFLPLGAPPWKAVGESAGPPIVVFYSFKGGVGRTTALSSFAIQRARMGERVAILDLDLDAPGIGALLAADDAGTTAEWGVVDYLLERPLGDVELRDYYHACRRSPVTGSGEILVVPAGSLAVGREFLGKLARLDLEPSQGSDGHPLHQLIEQVRSELAPAWICIDARAGLSEPAGMLLSGFAHLHVLFGTSSEQSWRGLSVVLERIGATRVRAEQPQLDCVLVHSMVPEDAATSKASRATFEARSLEEFRGSYYAPDPDDPDKDSLWYLRDAESSDAPHAPIAVSYQPRLAHFARIDDVADQLAESSELKVLGERIAARFGAEEN